MRWALSVEYEGTSYHGWQRQHRLVTVQSELECALSKVANHPVRVQCAGRTDARVHALQQVIHFDSDAARSPEAWVRGGNVNCANDIAIHWAQPVDQSFHARYCALSRRYLYRIQTGSVRSALNRNRTCWIPQELDVLSMHRTGQYLLGEWDFNAFRGAGCQSKSSIRNVSILNVQAHAAEIYVTIEANAFLLHMVRNIVGCLLEVGRGKKSASWIAEVLASRDRTQCAATAPPQGLYLAAVTYPDMFELPSGHTGVIE